MDRVDREIDSAGGESKAEEMPELVLVHVKIEPEHAPFLGNLQLFSVGIEISNKRTYECFLAGQNLLPSDSKKRFCVCKDGDRIFALLYPRARRLIEVVQK